MHALHQRLPLSVVFMGTPEIAAESLSCLISLININVIDLKCIYTKPSGWNSKRGESVKSPVNIIAEENKIRVRTPKTFKSNIKELSFLKDLKPDLIVVVAFGLILPQDILEIPKYGTINLHPSLLPDLRGPSPIHYAILENLKFTGVSIMVLDEGIDTGPLLVQSRERISKDEYFQDLYNRLSKTGSFLLSEVVKTIAKLHEFEQLHCEKGTTFSNKEKKNNESDIAYYNKSNILCKPGSEAAGIYLYAYPQSEVEGRKLTFTKRIDTNIQKIDFLKDSPFLIYSKIRAFSGQDAAFFTLNNKKIKVLKAILVVDNEEAEAAMPKNKYDKNGFKYDYHDYINEEFKEILKKIEFNEKSSFYNDFLKESMPGSVVLADKSGLAVKTAEKGIYITLLELKPEGKRLMNYIDFINGFRIKPGFVLK